MARDILCGIPADHIDAVADRLAGDLTIDFEGRESGFWGEYRLHDAGGVFEVRINHNEDPLYDPLWAPPGGEVLRARAPEPARPPLCLPGQG